MYIKKLILEKIRCFDHLEIDFTEPGQSLLLLGDNGDGKSTVLKSIAIGLCDESSASALFRELDGEFVKREKGRRFAKDLAKGIITIYLIGSKRKEYKIITTIISIKTFEIVHQKKGLWEKIDSEWKLMENQSDFPWKDIFISGYGAGPRTRGTEDFQHYLAVDATYSLFKYDNPLQNPELAIRRLMDAARESTLDSKEGDYRAKSVFDEISDILISILNLPSKKNILLSKAGIQVKGPWGRSELGELGDGYKATITWVLDLLAWWFLRAGGWRLEKLKGIVVVDEIEQHLHPRWQRSIIPMLIKRFPGVQFIFSTHSPLCSGSVSMFAEKKCKLIRLKRLNGSVEPEKVYLHRGLRADQILTSEAFSLLETREIDLDSKIQKYGKLTLKRKLTRKERSDLESLRREFRAVLPDIAESERDREVYNRLREYIE